MTQAKSELEELKELQKESQKLRDRQESPSAASQEARAAEKPVAESVEGRESPASAAEYIEELTGPVENILSELEEAASEHPALALLAAFGIGIFVGQLLSRR